ncbi:zinc-dependent alcohol dehydrogenase [Caldinitratiruptor microaerophilus]|uniref:L-idonate 5-dehydrogenase n=1 Tax=Caldinitratiruptor microaerophilus TaxID=671077 RepID=A0AA35G919_9FIRM|nr:alcohol dehydrogenase catalytic domain-containing protein [Caldinitratiruptor microaerophilus]BDG59839.1 L-idonate 5-dehydrogenase [Caldinitratiruptor microaerophilus]
MLAVVKRGPGPGIGVEEVPDPEPGPGEVLVRVRAAAICGSDLHMWAGHSGYEWVQYPLIPGHEVTGVIVATGAGVPRERVGERIVVNPYVPCGRCSACLSGSPQLCDGGGSAMEKVPARSLQIGFRRPGGFAELVTVPATSAVPLPEGLGFREAAPLEAFAVAVHAVELCSVRPGDRVAVLGPGPIGLGVVLALAGMGLELLILAGLSSDAARLARGRDLGATHTAFVDEVDLAQYVAALTGGAGLDAVFDATGNPAAVGPAIRSLRRGGELVLVGISGRPAELPLNQIVRGEIVLRGSYGITPRSLQRAAAMVASGRAPLGRLVTHVLPLSEAASAFELAHSAQAGKVLLAPVPEEV